MFLLRPLLRSHAELIKFSAVFKCVCYAYMQLCIGLRVSCLCIGAVLW
ncbi:hypothetical protein HMPREF0091_11135 [Fannyhessea vaginae DSM 15829]|uniref:Uncharacterized protein n=1 Tax=Fannyhessea vaginae DSM 15829 TaxID=525256 RepID=F1T6T4_9ACTN|nr:hypothetical protein HMPREF0091_11135 [Fannyhessea vaginae DSM 15829]